jgi:hypothetical protein
MSLNTGNKVKKKNTSQGIVKKKRTKPGIMHGLQSW